MGEVTESLENELCYDYNYELCSFSNPSVASPRSQFILQPFFRFSYGTGSSLTPPGKLPMIIREEIKRRINIGNTYYSLGKIFSSRLLSKKLKVSTYKTIIYQLCYMVMKRDLSL